MIEPTLRRATTSDLGWIEALEHSSFANPWPRRIYEEELVRPGSTPELATLDGEVVGFSCSWIIVDECHLLRIASDPQRRLRGIGRILLSAVIARAKAASCARIVLEVASRNDAAVRLYQRAGFGTAGTRRDYYRIPPDDALVMMLEL